MQESWSYIKYSNGFINKTKNLKDIPQDALLVSEDVVGLYPNIPHEAGLKDERENRNIATNDLIRMAEFVLKIIISNLMARLNSKYLEQPLVSNLHLHTLAFLWMTLKVNFLKLSRYNH